MYDDFDLPIGSEFIDGRTKSGPWAIMQPRSFAKHGVGLGLGKGQRYRKKSLPSGVIWEKIEG
jgi:hypothetical protein